MTNPKNYLLVGIVAAAVFLLGYFLFYRKTFHGKSRLTNRRVTWWVLFIVYASVILCSTLVSRQETWNGGRFVPLFASYKTAYKSASATQWRNLALNIMLFVPFGFLLPLGWRNLRAFWKTAVIGLAVTVGIECVQFFFSIGVAEADDILNNAIGTVIGYGLFEIFLMIWNFHGKKKAGPVRVVLFQMPLLAVIIVFVICHIAYQGQELGNLSVTQVTPYNMKNVTVSADREYSGKAGTAMVYKMDVYTRQETREMADAMFSMFGSTVNDRGTDVYDDSAYYRSADEYAYYVEMIYYLGGTFYFTDFETFFGDGVEKVYGASEEEIIEVLKSYGVDVPEGADFEELDGTYQFTADWLAVGDSIADGTVYCTYYSNGRLGELSNYIIYSEPYGECDIISEREAYEKICNGEFTGIGVESGMDIELGDVRMEYMADTKGFYQPIYIFEAKVYGVEGDIVVPALR